MKRWEELGMTEDEWFKSEDAHQRAAEVGNAIRESMRQADDPAIEAWLCSACGLAVSVSNPPVGVVHTCRERGWKPLVVRELRQ